MMSYRSAGLKYTTAVPTHIGNAVNIEIVGWGGEELLGNSPRFLYNRGSARRDGTKMREPVPKIPTFLIPRDWI